MDRHLVPCLLGEETVTTETGVKGPVEKAGGQFFGIWPSQRACSMVELDEFFFDLAHVAARVIDASDRVLHAFEAYSPVTLRGCSYMER